MKCPACGAKLGMFKKYVPLEDGGICYKCFTDLGYNIDDAEEYADYDYDSIKCGYGAFMKRKELIQSYGVHLAHYGEERDLEETDDETQMFKILSAMFRARGYDPAELRLVRKSNAYVSAVLGDFDIARMKYTERAKWIVFPSAEAKAVKHYIEAPEDIEQFGDLLDKVIDHVSKYTEIKKEDQ